MTKDLNWQEPPERKKGGAISKQDRIVGALRANPGRWALIHTAPNRQAAYAYSSWRKRGLSPAWTPTGDFDVTVRGLQVYARYIGGGDAPN